MSTLEERLEDEEYKLWVKAGVCLAAVKNGLTEFARTRSQIAHKHVKAALNNNTSVNNLCQRAKIQFDKTLKKWSLGCCANCQAYVDELENLKDPKFRFKPENWKTTDIKKWPNEPWEMMKVFMNPGQTAAQKDPSEADLSAILNFIDHCKIPRVDIYDQNNIKEVQAASFCITRSDEVKALNEKTTFILEWNSTLTAEIDELRSELENIRSSVNSGIKHVEALVKNETDDRQEAVDRMTKEMETKEKALEKLSVELTFVKMRINKDKALYGKMNIRIKTVEKTLRKTDKQFQGIKREHAEIKNELAEIKCQLQLKNGSDLKSNSTKDYQILKQNCEKQERQIEALHSDLNEQQIRHEQDIFKLRTRITELEQQNEIYSKRKEANASNQEVKEDKDLVNAHEKPYESFKRSEESKVQEIQTKLKEATEMNVALLYENDQLKSEAKDNTSFAALKEYENTNLQYQNEIERLQLVLCESDREREETQNMFQKLYRRINNLENNLQGETEKADIIKKDRLFTEEVLKCLTKDSAMILSEAVEKLEDVQTKIRHTFNYDKNGSQHDEDADEEIRTLIQSLFSTKRIVFGDTPSDTNADKLKQLIIQKISDLQQNFDQEHQLRNTAENDLKASQKTNEDLSKKIEELQKQVQTEKKTGKALEDQYKLSAAGASANSEKCISDLQQNFDQDHQLRNTAENDLKASQKTNEDLSEKIEELQKQVQTEKSTREAREDQHKLSAAIASGISEKGISDLQQIFDQEHKLRDTAENDQKASQKINEDLFQKTEEIRKQVQTEKRIREALEDKHKLSAAVASGISEKGISDKKVVCSSIVDVRLKKDKDLPWISGCVFVSTGQLVLCDRKNNKIKLLSSDLKVAESLHLQKKSPYDISAASSSAVVITLPEERQLQFIELSPELGHGQLIQLDEECWEVCVVGEEIYVTCGSFGFVDSDGEVRIYNTEGVVKRRLGLPTEPGSSYMFRCPDYLTVSASSGRMYVSDWGRDTLTCLSEDGSIIYQYRDPELISPHGLYVDADDYVIVCGLDSNILQMISPSGEKVSTLLSEKDGIMLPLSVAYRPTDGTLVIVCGGNNNLHVFKLSH